MADEPNMGGNWWARQTNRYCTCPPARYNPARPKPTSPECETHGAFTHAQGGHMKDKPRIGCGVTQDRTQIFNANYGPSGKRIGDFEHPWTVMGPDVFRMCATHEDALNYAHGQEGKGQ